MLHSLLGAIPSPSSGSVHIGPLRLNAYGLMIALGVIVAVRIAGRRAEARGITDTEGFGAIAMWGVPAGIIGGRAYHVITATESFRGNWVEALYVWKGGLGIWGGILCGVLAGVWKARRMACRSCCCACGPSAHAVCTMAWRACSMTARASAKNMTRISSSSASGGAAPVAGLAAEALVDGACASAVVKSASCDVVCASERAGMSRKSGAVGAGSGLKTSSPRAASKWKAFCANADW